MSNALPARIEDVRREAALPHTELMPPEEAEQVQTRPLPSRRRLGDDPLWPDYLAAIEANRQTDRRREVAEE